MFPKTGMMEQNYKWLKQVSKKKKNKCMSNASELRRYFLLILVIYMQRDNPKVHNQLKASKRTKPWKEEMRI